MAATGVTRRQAETVLNAAAGFANKGPSAELDDALKIETGGVRKRNTSCMFPSRKQDAALSANMQNAMHTVLGVLPTGATGAFVDLMKAVPVAMSLMPGVDNVITRKLQASAMFRRAALCVAARLRVLSQLQPAQAANNPFSRVDTDKDGHHFVHMRLQGDLCTMLQTATGFTVADWEFRSWSLSIDVLDFASVLANLFGGAPLSLGPGTDNNQLISAQHIQFLFQGYVPHGSDSMLLHQLDRMFAELCELAALPDILWRRLSEDLRADGGTDYMVADPLAQQGLDTIDLRLLSTLRDSTAKELTLPAWPGQFKRAPPQEGPDSQMEGQVQKLADARTLVRGVVLNRLLTCPEDLVLSIMFDGAKMTNGCIRKELVQTVIHVMCPQLQVPLMNYVQTREHLTRRERVDKRARAEAGTPQDPHDAGTAQEPHGAAVGSASGDAPANSRQASSVLGSTQATGHGQQIMVGQAHAYCQRPDGCGCGGGP